MTNPLWTGLRWSGLATLLTLLACSRPPDAEQSSQHPISASEAVTPVPVKLTYVGSQECANCHAEQMSLWQGSHHEQAMLSATENNVKGDFSDATFVYGNTTTTFSRRGDEFWVQTDNRNGELQDFRIAYTFGVEPLQQYLIEFDDGRIQALNVVWDDRPANSGGQRWMHLYPDETIDHADPLHWTGRFQNWNFMCAECHSTNLQKRYSPSDNTFDTIWSEINVACEACHGPGSRHLDWARKDEDGFAYRKLGVVASLSEGTPHTWVMDSGTGIAQRRPALRLAPIQPEACGRCHARRSQLTATYRYNRPLMDTHLPALLTDDLYYQDGQIKEEVYVYGSFLQSKMYAAGVSCSDCHDPHSLRLKADGNAMCATCHATERFDSPAHHQHANNQVQCVDCHMPTRDYMVVDGRRDHSFRVPRPDLSVSLETPNACTGCHIDETAQWAQARVEKWYPNGTWTQAHYGESLAAARSGRLDGQRKLELLASDTSAPDIVRATALAEIRPGSGLSQNSAVVLALRDSSPLVRKGAVDGMREMSPQLKAGLLSPLLEDPVLGVRLAAVFELASASNMLQNQWREAFNRVSAEYIHAQNSAAERAEAQLNLGIFYLSLQRFTEAEQALQRALFLDSMAVPAMVNLADVYRQSNREEEAEGLLRDGIASVGENAALEYTLGLLLVRTQRTEEAVQRLASAARLQPGNERYRYVLGVALNSTGKPSQAIETLEQASDDFPFNTDILWALATMHRDLGHEVQARSYAKRLLDVNPDNPNALELLNQLSPSSDEG